MDKEFEDYWNLHQRHLILSAPEKLRSEYMEAGRIVCSHANDKAIYFQEKDRG